MAYTRNSEETVAFRRKRTYFNGVTTAVTSEPLSRVLTASRSGEKMPGWRDKIRLRQNASTPYSLDSYKVLTHTDGSYAVGADGDARFGWLPRVDRFDGLMTPISAPFAHLLADQSRADAIALTKLYSKVNAQISHTNVPAALVEFGDVVRQFGSPARSILKLTERHINRLYLQRRGIEALKYNKPKLIKTLADTYLEYAFGLAPLINDSKKAAEALARWVWETNKDNTSRPPTKLVGRGSHSVATTSVSDATPMASNLILTRTQVKNTEARAQYTCGYSSFLTADLGSYERLQQLLGFRPESWIPAVWEAVPWSWLADYFSNVQGILNSLEASKVAPTWLCKTVSTVTDSIISEHLSVADSLYNLSMVERVKTYVVANSQGESSCRRTTLQRTIPVSLGLPSVYFQLPEGLNQFANMTAVLLSQQRSAPMISLETNYRAFLRSRLHN